MWITEALTEPPRGSRLGVGLTWARTLALSVAAAATGHLVDLLLGAPARTGLSVTALLVAIGILVFGAAVTGGLGQALPPVIQAREEALWRAPVARAALSVRTAARPDGEWIDTGTTAVEKTAGYRATFLGPTLASFTAPLLVLAVWGWSIGWGSAALLTAFVALVPLTIMASSRWLKRPNATYRRLEARDAARYLQMLRALGTLRVFGADARYRRRHAEDSRQTMAELGRLLARNQTTIIVNDAVFGILMTTTATALVLWGLAQGALTAGQATAGLLLSVLLNEPIAVLGRTFYVGLGGRARREGIEALLAEAQVSRQEPAPAIAQAPAAMPGAAPAVAPAPAPSVTLESVTLAFGDRVVLEDVDLHLAGGSTTALVGSSGAGKTTLLRLVQGLLEPQAGRVLLDGHPTTAQQRLGTVAVVGQHPAVLSTTIADNLRLAAPHATDEQLWEALEVARFAQEVREMPHGLAEPVGEEGALLSGGQRRRLGLARAVLSRAPILVLDEPTADLDRRTEALVRESLAEVTRHRTVLVVSHRAAAITGADATVKIVGGKVVRRGRTEGSVRA